MVFIIIKISYPSTGGILTSKTRKDKQKQKTMINLSFNYFPIAQRGLSSANNTLATAMRRLSTGCKINSAGDNAAGLSLSNKLSKTISGLDMSYQNTQQGIGLINTADGAVSNMINDIQRIRNLAVQSANGVYSNSERAMLNAEAQELKANVKQTYKSTTFGDKNIFDDTIVTNTPVKTVQAVNESLAEANGYIVIKTAQDFIDKIPQDGTGTAGKTYILAADIDMSSITDYIPKTNFQGTFDGNGHTISNLTLSDPSLSYRGLFGSINGATIQNISLDNFSIQGNSFVGSLVGVMTNSKVYNSKSENLTIDGIGSNSGGLIGSTLESYDISNCVVFGNVYGTNTKGGLVGSLGYHVLSNGTISNCSSYANVSGGTFSGGLVGYAGEGNHIITQSFTTGNISGDNGAGGIVGRTLTEGMNLTISNCYSSSIVNSTSGAGGLLLVVQGTGITIRDSYSTGLVVGNANSGGIIGVAGGSYPIPECSGVFWNSQTSGQTSAVPGITVEGATGLSTQQTQNPQTYIDAGYDTNIWNFGPDGTPVLDWQVKAETQLHIGENADENSQFNLDTGVNLGGLLSVNLTTSEDSRKTIEKCDEILEKLLQKRSYFGASLNVLESVLNSNRTRTLNLNASKSVITDTDMAKESASMIKAQILKEMGANLLTNYKSNYSNLLLTLLK